jgi:Domain of Unknown Function (DUF1080)
MVLRMNRFLKKSIRIVGLLYLTINIVGCGQNKKNEPTIATDGNAGFNAIFFDIQDTEIKLDNADAVGRTDKRFESINLNGKASFWPDHDHYFMNAMGVITFPDSASYKLRLAASGKTLFRLNNIEIFRYNGLVDTLAENTVNNNVGENIFEIEYFDGGMMPKIVLEWSKDGGPFSVVPTEAFTVIQRKQPENTREATQQEDVTTLNVLTESEKKEGWKLLFDGKTTKGWHKYNAPGTIGSKWVAENGSLTFKGRNRFRYTLDGYFMEMGPTDSQADGGKDIVTDESYSDFELKLEWKISQGGNSGIFYTVMEDPKYNAAWNTSPEMQVLDDFGHKDGIIYKHRSGDLYDLIACSEPTVRPAGAWNQVRIVKNKGNIQHWLNDVMVVEYSLNSPEWKELLSKSKFADFKDYATTNQCRIGLQDHDNEVWFRNIKIKEL